jgi:hypothetical protein
VLRPDFGLPGLGAGMGKGNTRQVLNNILCVDRGTPGVRLPRDASHFTTDSNILWSFDASGAKVSAPAGNQIADPGFKQYATDWREPIDLTPRAGVEGATIPKEWFDPVGSRDVGALPTDGKPWRIGVQGRLDVCGRASIETSPLPEFAWSFPGDHAAQGPHPDAPHALSIRGYPAWDAPILEYLLRRRGVIVEKHDREAVPLTADLLAHQKLVLYDGSLTRGGVQPATLGADDVSALENWLKEGGTLVLGFKRQDIFNNETGRAFLVRHLDSAAKDTATPASNQMIRIGKGRIVVLGSSPGSTLTDNRRGSTPEADAAMLAQVRVLQELLDECLHRPEPSEVPKEK